MCEPLFHFFGLRENPFRASPDPRFYFPTSAFDGALAELIHGVDTPKGLLVLTGEAGTGKTTLLHHFLTGLRERRRSSSYVFHPRLKPKDLFDCILRDFGVACETGKKGNLLAMLHQWLIRRHAMGDSPVVVIDEAHASSLRTLDQLRFLLKLETAGRKLLHIVLAGQPELEEKLRQPELRRLNHHVVVRCNLPLFSMEETSQYVKSRLASAGATNVDVFAQESLEALHCYGRGIPRTVNLLCEQALIAGYAQRVKIITADVIRRVAADFELTPQPAAAGERGISTRYGLLVPLRPEVMPDRVAPPPATVNSVNAESVILEPASPGTRKWQSNPLREVEPISIVEQPIALAPSAAQPANEPMTAAESALHVVRTTIGKSIKGPEPALPNNLRVGGKGSALAERFVRHGKEASTNFVRAGKQFMSRYTAKPEKKPMTAADPTLQHVVPAIAEASEDLKPVLLKKLLVDWQGLDLGKRFLEYWNRVSAFVGVGNQFKKVLVAKPENEPRAAVQPTFHQVSRTIAKPTEDPAPASPEKLPMGRVEPGLGKQFVCYWEQVGASFLRDWNRFMKVGAGTAANEPMAAAEPTLQLTVQTMEKPTEIPELALPQKLSVDRRKTGLGERVLRYGKVVGASFVRDWRQLVAAHGSAWAVARKGRRSL